MKRLHYATGLLLGIFIVLHLTNHLTALYGPDRHIATMNLLRTVYRNPLVEVVLLGAVLVQIMSGLRLFWRTRQSATSFFSRLQRWSGLYLAVFFLIHLSAVLSGRFVLHLDTNFYFGVAGLNTFPFSLFFVPYYGLAILSFCGHLAAAHSQKMTRSIVGLSPFRQAIGMLLCGFLLTIVLFYCLTNGYRGVAIPSAYGVLIGN
jgi:succinate dehydrogenase/fumarate reductase cytochrome b subunit